MRFAPLDRLMVEQYRITPLQTMENAGRNLALLAKQMLDDDLVDRPVVVLVGRGNKGGAGLVAARHLLNWGAWVQILLSHPSTDYTGVDAQQLSTLQAMAAPLARGGIRGRRGDERLGARPRRAATNLVPPPHPAQALVMTNSPAAPNDAFGTMLSGLASG